MSGEIAFFEIRLNRKIRPKFWTEQDFSRIWENGRTSPGSGFWFSPSIVIVVKAENT